MDDLYYIDRISGKKEQELVFGEKALKVVYGNSVFAGFLQTLTGRWALPSKLYGWLQKRRYSAKKVIPFIKEFNIDTKEFERAPDSFCSFNDFFIRKLHPECRPIAKASAVMPADARYIFCQNIQKQDPFSVKEKSFCLETFLQDHALAKTFSGGTLIRARLCPTDCHRFYFPVDGVPSKPNLINGTLFSVNPIATLLKPHIWMENKRWITRIETKEFGKVLFVTIGATNVGSLAYTYEPDTFYSKGSEMGYFEFGGSAIVLLFQPGKITLSKDLMQHAKHDLEVRCLIGQSL